MTKKFPGLNCNFYSLTRNMAAPKQKSHSIKEPVDILKAVDGRARQHESNNQIAKEFGIANSTHSTIVKDP